MAAYNGLSTSEAAKRLRRDGGNILEEKKRNGMMSVFLGQFRDIMMIILLAATVISAFLGDIADAVAIIAIVLLNAVLGFVQEYRSEKTLEKLKSLSAPEANVIRDGKQQRIPAALLVRGDIVLLGAGDRIPADCIIRTSSSLFSDESLLTGESVPTEKSSVRRSMSDDEPLKRNYLYAGCSVSSGNCVAEVIETGKQTQIGGISKMLSDIRTGKTPLQERLGELGRTLALICIGVCIVVFASGVLRGEPVFDMLMTGISIAVAAIPEGLPATVTIALSLAVGRMFRHKALVNKLHSVETLGCTSVICTDKTGTLTMNKMCVCSLWYDGGEASVSGNGLSVFGSIERNGRVTDINSDPTVSELLKCAALCTSSEITRSESKTAPSFSRGDWIGFGDPTEIALLICAEKGKADTRAMKKSHEKVNELPFDSERKSMTVTVRAANGGRTSYTKGACETLLNKCAFYLHGGKPEKMTEAYKTKILNAAAQYSSEALRVLLLAKKSHNAGERADDEMVFLGLAAMLDPPRKEAAAAIAECKSANIGTIMITGDNPATAAAIARKTGLDNNGGVLSGNELDALSDYELSEKLGYVNVFARVAPAHKLRIVRLLRGKGEIVTMTGDGVNDAPAVREADVGVAMGISGTDVTKEAADVVLLDDNFATLVRAVREGRAIYSNIRKFVRYLLSCNIGEVLTMLLGIIMGMPVVLLPIQLLLVNLVTDGLPAIALGLEPPEADIMKNKPRSRSESFFSEGLATKIVFRGIFIALCTLSCFSFVLSKGAALSEARTCALLTLVFSQLIHVFECKSEHGSIFTVRYFSNIRLLVAVALSLAAMLACVGCDALRFVFQTSSISGELMKISVIFASAVPLLSALIGLLGLLLPRKRGECIKYDKA